MFKNILCATDLNDASSQAVKTAVQMAHQYNATITMLNVQEEFMTKDERGMLRVSIDVMKNQFEKNAVAAKEEMKQEISKLHADDIKVEYCLREGNPEKIICEESLKKKIDLIIMGVSEKNMLVNFIYKSTASYVIDNVSIPVLVVSIKNK